MSKTQLLVIEGDRTCEECGGKGELPEETEDAATGDWYEVAVDCPHCEHGRITERQNPKTIDLAWPNAIGRDLILNERFRSAIRRRQCHGRGVLHDRFIIHFCGNYGYPTILPSGPKILLPGSPIGVTAAIEYLEWKNAGRAIAA